MARTKFQTCMSRRLKGKMAGKTKARRDALFSAAAKACSRETGGTSKPRSKPRAKSKRRTGTTQRRSSHVSAPRARSSSRKPVKTVRRKGKLERKRIDTKKEFDDIARALGVPLSKTSFKIVGNQWVLRAGKVKAKRVKLADAMKIFRQNARKRL